MKIKTSELSGIGIVMSPKKWSIENRVYLEAETYEQAVSKFWDLMEKANIGSLFNAQPTPNCFVDNVEETGEMK